ncbi:hypothetical protein H9L19_05075 [Weissella diestrammenae]|uniref:Uncharacterized protein n=1 Tax=Weissella diestrammenae TaxID=1162633 RepID=A0A7G9T3W2_9LACO|nr:hypothetical protein [Weissella diestrammenae]MCM0582112.1 hypothetical protein [Weissella diestrammenae]QNN74787.1 hypothetical protein H9L19_05075 [Weissella diestrammenae]
MRIKILDYTYRLQVILIGVLIGIQFAPLHFIQQFRDNYWFSQAFGLILFGIMMPSWLWRAHLKRTKNEM